MVGEKPTGLGVYSRVCAKVLPLFRSGVIGLHSPCGDSQRIGEVNVTPPAGVSIGSGRFSAIRRNFWLRRLRFGRDILVYTPTHHGLGGQDGQIITLHDMICLRFPWQHPLQYLYFKLTIPKLLRRCRAVFTVSETTKRHIAETYKYPLKDIYVVPNSINPGVFRPAESQPTADFILMVGARYSHKNVVEVLLNHEAWSPRYRLVVTSCSGKYRKQLDKLILELGLVDFVQFHDYLEFRELVALYQNCAALIYPSKWEGFGIPPLEALACGRPVIVSDIPVHREVLADSAIYVTLGSSESWQSAFEVLQDSLEVSRRVRLKSALLSVEPGLELR